MMNSRPTKKPEQQRGPFKELRKSLNRLLSSRAFLLIISLLAAISFWCVMVLSDGTLTREKVFQNVSVSVTGEAALKSRGYIVMDDLDEVLGGVKMTVEVTQSNYNRVSGTSYNPHIDLSKVTGEGENELDISFSSQLYGPVTKCEPNSVTVNVERYMTRRIPVTIEYTGEAAAGVYLDSAKTDPSTLSVSGPQSLVSVIARAVVRLDRTALSAERMSDKTTLAIELQNAAGEAIESDKLEVTNQSVITNSVVVETELVPMKEIPLDVQNFVTGEPAEGYELVEVYTQNEAVSVAAKQEILDALTVLTTDQPLDITGATGNVSGYVKLKRPTDIENTVATDVGVTALIQEKMLERTFRQVPVDVDGLLSDMKASLSKKQMTVQLTGGYGFITGLETDDLRLFVDVSGLEAGEHTLPVQIRIDNAQEFACALSSPEITVTISAQ